MLGCIVPNSHKEIFSIDLQQTLLYFGSVFLYNKIMLNSLFYINSPSLISVTSTRSGGVSRPPYDSLNLAFQTGDHPNLVQSNREIFYHSLSINPIEVIHTYQSHSTTLVKVSTKDLGKGNQSFESGVKGDALYTTDKNVPLAVFHADCSPVILYTKNHQLACVIHAGKEGSLEKITLNAIKTIMETEKIDPSSLIAHIGPSLEFSHHPISLEEVDRILAIDKTYSQIIKLISGTFFLDIPLLNYMHLIDAGISIDNIHVSSIDTYSDPNCYFSYQREAKTGRHVSLIMLK